MREETIRIIFGLKLRQLRLEQNMSLSKLAKLSGLSSSYLNEIEKGKKKPKAEKIAALAKVFNVSYDDMVSLQLTNNLAPIGDLLMTNILNDIPLEVFGFTFNHLVDLMWNAPAKVAAFFKTIIEISRNYDLQKEYFYFATLRSYQEISNNYFEAIEKEANAWTEDNNLKTESPSTSDIEKHLTTNYNYNFSFFDVQEHPNLNGVRSFLIGGKNPTLMLHPNINEWQKRYILARELGYKALNTPEDKRPYFPLLLKAPNFDLVFNNFKASYFSAAILIPEKVFISQLKKFFSNPKWDSNQFLQLIKLYNVSPEIFLLRMTNVMPKHFGIKQLFFLRFQSIKNSNKFKLTRELHLGQQHSPHANENYRHYCRRWASLQLLKEIDNQTTKSFPLVKAQISKQISTGEQYFSIALARPMTPTPNYNVSVSIDWLINENTKKHVAFLNAPDIETFEVNNTCESCPLTDCKEREVPPSLLEQKNLQKSIRETITQITEEHQN